MDYNELEAQQWIQHLDRLEDTEEPICSTCDGTGQVQEDNNSPFECCLDCKTKTND